MKKETYQSCMNWWNNHPKVKTFIHICNWVLTGLVFAAYPILLIGMYFYNPEELALAIIVPLNSFILVSVFRQFLNRKRPYEKFQVAPALAKDKKGNSFPSRHVFCVFVIAMTFLYVLPNPIPGILLLGVGVLHAVLRVAVGVHYISDVLAGALLGILAGTAFWL